MIKLRTYPIFAALALFALACQLIISFGHVHVAEQVQTSQSNSGLFSLVENHPAHNDREPQQREHHDHDDYDHDPHAPANGPHEDGEPCFACVLKHLSGSVVLPVAAELKIDQPIVSHTVFYSEQSFVTARRTKHTRARAPPTLKTS